MFRSNAEWEILSDNIWADFNGIIKDQRALRKIIFDDSEVWASDNHPFVVDGVRTKLKDLPHTGFVDGVNHTKVGYKKTDIVEYADAYDIVESSNNHTFNINSNILSSNCDEFAHVDPSVASEFWTSISPTLSTGGKAIIASTPNGDMNLYATLARGAKAGTNGFAYVHIGWDEPPGRDEEFKRKEIAKIGLNAWLQEYECCRGDTLINIMDNNGIIRELTINELVYVLQH